MNPPAKTTIGCFTVILFLGVLYFWSPSLSTACPPTSDTKLESLTEKVDLLQKINDKLLQTVYWTLGTLAAIFIAIISVNLFFNISANKREIQKIKEDIESRTINLIKTAEIEIGEKNNAIMQKEFERLMEEIANVTISEIKTSEANLVEKTYTATEREIEKASTNILNVAKNEDLTHKAELTKLMEQSTEILRSVSSDIETFNKQIPELEVRVRELEVYKYSKERRMGAIIGQIELLEYDLENRSWNIEFRLPEILKEIKSSIIYPSHAEKLRALLGKIKDTEHQKIIKEILASISVRKPEDIS